MGRARHAAALEPAFLDRFAVVGSPENCVDRLRQLVETGLSKLVLVGASLDANRDEARRSRALLEEEVIPALREH
jgi:5,10-methylenetetrahydromethanopterin reductase